ncbi:MAG: hypothetical protein IPO60_09755 [Flavobacteriales bacterium]|nr:hypothetical protein [Flavobacteriales bacterium]
MDEPILQNDTPDTTAQDWGKAYLELCELLHAKVPGLKHFDLYYGQEMAVDGDGNWLAFRAPAVFFEFSAAQVVDLGGMSQQLDMEITVYLYVETVQDTNKGSLGQARAMEFTGLLRQIHAALHGTSGEHFSTLGPHRPRAGSPPYVYMYAQSYGCVLIDNGAVVNLPDIAAPPLDVQPDPA